MRGLCPWLWLRKKSRVCLWSTGACRIIHGNGSMNYLAIKCRIWPGFPGGASGKESACQCRRCKGHRFDPWVRKVPWERNDSPLQNSYLENPRDRGAWQITVHGVTKSWTRLSDWITATLVNYWIASHFSPLGLSFQNPYEVGPQALTWVWRNPSLRK